MLQRFLKIIKKLWNDFIHTQCGNLEYEYCNYELYSYVTFSSAINKRFMGHGVQYKCTHCGDRYTHNISNRGLRKRGVAPMDVRSYGNLRVEKAEELKRKRNNTIGEEK